MDPRPARTHVERVRVRYAETDQMGVVHHANYLGWFEVARVEWLRTAGVVYRDLEAQGFLLPVIEAHLRYRRSALYDDLLDVSCTPDVVRAASMRFRYTIRRGDELIAEGTTSHACIDRAGRPMRFPPVLRDLLT